MMPKTSIPTLRELCARLVDWDDLPEVLADTLYSEMRQRHRALLRPCLTHLCEAVATKQSPEFKSILCANVIIPIIMSDGGWMTERERMIIDFASLYPTIHIMHPFPSPS